ncbi:MAG: Hydrogenase-2 operon protein HybE [Candidatus Accumulibacter regalis]|uniref:Hydrogenase-2 operon protein HybE n=1 Tax=Accumulibacter regalis TaxID=522306 RepID=A0A011QMW7_ACCRE|nr:[NiFe]-hydrogenase assembly chaperone HybE [Accumulibacter sp.]EXI90667.1 MAG: Hydrogenase-2 operon protein HybE [Candidatus Accumulibacter regalis]HRE69160.1 [NiFe]-hydrogenase assembly chaperone HybE [Accumulibacter sp.]HRE85027.1 [NiFe]-hydrogenase assembly chaperone HybE [Accumulibacter sp.]
MTTGIRKAAFQAPRPAPAEPISDNPAARLEAMYRRIWLASMRDLPFVNLALSVEAVGFRRWQAASDPTSSSGAGPYGEAAPRSAASRERSSSDGLLGDWVGAVITPWFINLFIVPGGGDLWSDRPSGERCRLVFPIGPLEFIADDDASAEVPAYQYCPLFAPPGQFASQAAARAGAMAALNAMFGMPDEDCPRPAAEADPLLLPARRRFLRRVARR